jgi:predicted transcriptional regulator
MIKPTLKAVARVKYAMKVILNTKMPMVAIVKKLNPIIRG